MVTMVRGAASVVLLGTALVGFRPFDGTRPSSRADSAGPVAGASYRADVAATQPFTQDGVAAMRRGLEALKQDRPAAAQTAFMEAARLLPGFEDWAFAYAAEAAAAAERPDTVDALLARIDPWLALERGWMFRVDARRHSGRTAEALPIALDAADRLSTPERRAAAAFEAAQIQRTLRDSTGGTALLRRVIDIAPGSTVALDAARQLSAQRGTSADDALAIGRLYARHGNTARAISGFEDYLSARGGSVAERGGATVELAQALFDSRRYAEAERRLRGALGTAVPDSIAAEATMLLGRAIYRQGNAKDGRATLLSVGAKYPHARAAGEAYWILADLDHDDGRLRDAVDLYERSVVARPADYYGRISAMRVGAMMLSGGDTEGAIRVFRAFHAGQTEPDWRQQGAFWMGRALIDAGDTVGARPFLQEARTIDPVAWYGLRAADLLRAGSLSAVLPASPDTGPSGSSVAEGALRRLGLLLDLELEDAYALELERVRRLPGDGALYAIAEGLHARGRTLDAVLIGRFIKRNDGTWNPRLLRIVYPFPYKDQILAQAEARGLDPYIVAGLIRQESLFDPRARSRADARGLMQVVPRTGVQLARQDGLSGFQTASLYQPETNLRLGTRYFADLLSRYDGHVIWVLAAYNAGPSRMARWREMPEARDPDLFAERIPFRETRDYVKVVQQNARIYRAVYGD